MTLVSVSRPRTAAVANWGRWVVECPRCPGALKVTPGTPVVECWTCGLSTEVVWPSVELQQGIERLLSLRPNPATRNWNPGESLHDLLAENLAHGIHGITDTGQSLAIVGDKIEQDSLPKPKRRLQIGA